MSKPVIRSGRFTHGADLQCGANVVIDVAEEVRVGDRCVLPDHAYLSGRRIEIGDDFFGFTTTHLGNALDVGRGRIDEEDAILMVGSRCTFHNNRIDLARQVTIGDDVGLSPDVVIYTHGYWQNVLDGFPATFRPVQVGSNVIVGFRSVLLSGTIIEPDVVIGAQSVVAGHYLAGAVYAGNPARLIREIETPSPERREILLHEIVNDYRRSCEYRRLERTLYRVRYPKVWYGRCEFDVATLAVEGDEDEYTDDWRDFAFRRGLRFYTKRPFRKLGRQA